MTFIGGLYDLAAVAVGFGAEHLVPRFVMAPGARRACEDGVNRPRECCRTENV